MSSDALPTRLLKGIRPAPETLRQQPLSSVGLGDQRRKCIIMFFGVVLAVVAPVVHWWEPLLPDLPYLVRNALGTSLSSARGLLNVTQWLAAMLLLAALVRFWEGRSWASLGIRIPSPWDPLLGVFFLLLGLMVEVHLMVPLWTRTQPAFPRGPGDWGWVGASIYPLPSVVFFSVVDAIMEEIGSRAYVVERFSEVTGSLMVGGAISWLLSIAMHVPAWGGAGALQAAPWLLVYVCFYLWRRNLWASTALHVLSEPEAWITLVALAPAGVSRAFVLLVFWR